MHMGSIHQTCYVIFFYPKHISAQDFFPFATLSMKFPPFKIQGRTIVCLFAMRQDIMEFPSFLYLHCTLIHRTQTIFSKTIKNDSSLKDL